MARVTGTPLHFFSINTHDAISGKALKALESRFTKKIRRATVKFGVTWASAMSLALAIENEPGGQLSTQWEPPETRDDTDILDNLGQKQDILEVPIDTLREEYGYSKEDISKFNKQPPTIPTIDPAVKMAQQIKNGG
jgi:hypothetical protein